MSAPVIALRAQREVRPAVPEAAYILDGVTKHVRFSDAASVPFEVCSPVRAFRSWPGKPNYSGWYWSSTVRRHIGFESLYERASLMTLDRDPLVVGISSQPLWIHWPEGHKPLAHAPDYFARYGNGDGELIDVRPEPLIDGQTTHVFNTTKELCDGAGFRYRVISDLSRALNENLKFLGRYQAHQWAPDDAQRLPRGSTFSLGEIAKNLAGTDGLPVGLGRTYWLIWHQQISADLEQPLSLNTPVMTAHERTPEWQSE